MPLNFLTAGVSPYQFHADNLFRSDRKISFKFPPYVPANPQKTSFDGFAESYGSFNLDNALLYVHFGQVDLEQLVLRVRRNETSSDRGTGKKDMQQFFKWLRKKEVKSIVKVIVEDRKSPAHSDQVIEEALKDLTVEILDWRKYDLCPMAIRNACKSSQLREIHLWWSGNNTTLRSWSEPDGLVKLEKLEHVHLHKSQVRAPNQQQNLSSLIMSNRDSKHN